MVFFIVGFIASLMGAISGLGGGVILKPILDAVTNLDSSVIGFLSTCTVFTMSLAAVIKHIQIKTAIDKKTTIFLGIGATFGGIIGTEIFKFVLVLINNDNLIKIIQNGLLFIFLLLIIIYINLKNKIQFKIKNIMAIVLIGCILGSISSFLGIGGGPINIAAFALFFSMDLRNATVNSIVLILFSQASKIVTLFVSRSVPQTIELSMVFWIIPAAILGGIFGTVINKRIDKEKLRTIYNSVMVFVILTCSLNIINLI